MNVLLTGANGFIGRYLLAALVRAGHQVVPAVRRPGDPRSIATVSRHVVIADFLFTAPAAVIQPLSGVALAWLGGVDLLAPWLVAAYLLYALAGACWLPVIRLQIRIRDLAGAAVAASRPLPPAYRRCIAIWFALGWPAFGAFLVIFWLMVAKPDPW